MAQFGTKFSLVGEKKPCGLSPKKYARYTGCFFFFPQVWWGPAGIIRVIVTKGGMDVGSVGECGRREGGVSREGYMQQS